jgi:hypothetical protein
MAGSGAKKVPRLIKELGRDREDFKVMLAIASEPSVRLKGR